MAIKVTSPVSDSERLNKEEASYYAKIGATSGQITITHKETHNCKDGIIVAGGCIYRYGF